MTPLSPRTSGPLPSSQPPVLPLAPDALADLYLQNKLSPSHIQRLTPEQINAPSPTTGMSLLHRVVETGSMNDFLRVLNQGGDLNARVQRPDAGVGDPDTPLAGCGIVHIAALARHTPLMKWLIREKPNCIDEVVDLPEASYWGYSPLHCAADCGDATGLQLLIGAGANRALPVAKGTLAGLLPIHLAAAYDHPELIDSCCDANQSVSASSCIGGLNTHVMKGADCVLVAALYGAKKSLVWLERQGHHMDQCATSGVMAGLTPLMVTALTAQLDLDDKRRLKASVDAFDFLRTVCKADPTRSQRWAMLNVADAGGLKVNVAHIAAAANHVPLLERLRELRMIREDGGETVGDHEIPQLAVHAAAGCAVNTLKWIAGHGARLDLPVASGPCRGLTIAHIAAGNGRNDVEEMLSWLNANGTALATTLRTPAKEGREAGLTPVLLAAKCDSAAAYDKLRMLGVDVKAKAGEGRNKGLSCAHLAAMSGGRAVLDLLRASAVAARVRAGATNDPLMVVARADSEHAGLTPLDLAAAKGNTVAVAAFMDWGYDVLQRRTTGKAAGLNALDHATMQGEAQTIELMLSRLSPSAREIALLGVQEDPAFVSPLVHAVGNGHVSAFTALLPHVQGERGDSVLRQAMGVAAQRGAGWAMELLAARGVARPADLPGNAWEQDDAKEDFQLEKGEEEDAEHFAPVVMEVGAHRTGGVEKTGAQRSASLARERPDPVADRLRRQRYALEDLGALLANSGAPKQSKVRSLLIKAGFQSAHAANGAHEHYWWPGGPKTLITDHRADLSYQARADLQAEVRRLLDASQSERN